jgi:hypothetical protein
MYDAAVGIEMLVYLSRNDVNKCVLLVNAIRRERLNSNWLSYRLFYRHLGSDGLVPTATIVGNIMGGDFIFFMEKDW